MHVCVVVVVGGDWKHKPEQQIQKCLCISHFDVFARMLRAVLTSEKHKMEPLQCAI